MKQSDDEFDLAKAARQTMIECGFLADFGPEVLGDLSSIERRAAERDGATVTDLRALIWSSIDDEASRDLDQIEVAERCDDGAIRVRIGIADVDALVARGSAVDAHAAHNTTSVYTGVTIFPMLPERLSTDLTSLNHDATRLAAVIDFRVEPDGGVTAPNVHRTLVSNRARLSYASIGAWLEGATPPPPEVVATPGLEEQLRLQEEAASRLKRLRQQRGALDLETIEARPVAENGKVVDLTVVHKSRARDLIEDFMIAANGAMARFLDARGVPAIRRVVKAPERWARLVALAATVGASLPETPSSAALSAFLEKRRAEDPEGHSDLSLAVVKLMGPGEYALERPGQRHDGHFGLAVHDYTHSTAPNRRFADLVTQRLVKAALAGAPPPYTDAELDEIARRCTEKENDARKVERTTRKQAAALLLARRIGEGFDAIVTGVNPRGTFVRLVKPPAEGRVVRGEEGLDVGDHVRVKLVDTSPARGFIDFARE